MGAMEASSEMTVYTDKVDSQAMRKPYTRPAGPPLSKPCENSARTVSHVMSSHTAKAKSDQKPKRRLRTCFLPRRANVSLSVEMPLALRGSRAAMTVRMVRTAPEREREKGGRRERKESE